MEKTKTEGNTPTRGNKDSALKTNTAKGCNDETMETKCWGLHVFLGQIFSHNLTILQREVLYFSQVPGW